MIFKFLLLSFLSAISAGVASDFGAPGLSFALGAIAIVALFGALAVYLDTGGK